MDTICRTGTELILRYRASTIHTLIGIMSGTSFDGIDAVLVSLRTDSQGRISRLEMKGSVSVPYSDEFKRMLLSLCHPDTARIDNLVYAHFAVSEWYAHAVQKLLEQSHLDPSMVDALCLHGQTVWHAPQVRAFPGPEGTLNVKGTLQIGSAPVLQERTGIPVLFDFRSRDMAAQGEGAPLAPVVDALLFGDSSHGRIVQNIGGIGNATVIPAGNDPDSVYAFDTGPGNMIIDELVRRKTGGSLSYDADGAFAAKGRVDSQLLDMLMQDPFFSQSPPKSTGREVYGSAFVDNLVRMGERKHLDMDDLIATATAFTAESIVQAYRDFIFSKVDIHEVIVCGGGACNRTLMRMIQERLPAHMQLMASDELGIPASAREAIAFAMLGHLALMGLPGNIPAVTGARHPAVLGNLTL